MEVVEFGRRLCVAANEADASEVAGGRDRPIIYGPHHVTGLRAAAELAVSEERAKHVDDLLDSAAGMNRSARALDNFGEHEEARVRRLTALCLEELAVGLRMRGDMNGEARSCERCGRYDSETLDCPRTTSCLPGYWSFIRKVTLPEPTSLADSPRCELNKLLDQLQQDTGRTPVAVRLPAGTPLVVSSMLPWRIAVVVHPSVRPVLEPASDQDTP